MSSSHIFLGRPLPFECALQQHLGHVIVSGVLSIYNTMAPFLYYLQDYLIDSLSHIFICLVTVCIRYSRFIKTSKVFISNTCTVVVFALNLCLHSESSVHSIGSTRLLNSLILVADLLWTCCWFSTLTLA